MSEEAQSKRGATPEPTEEGGAGFRVIDRRRFAPDGSERTAEDPSGGSAAVSSASESGAAPSRGSAPDAGGGAPAGSRTGDPATAGKDPSANAMGPDFVMSDAPERGSEALPEATLSTLVLSLSTQVLMHLGEIPDMATGKPMRDLPAARSIIDLLAVLQRKTEGNLDAAESALFDRILYDLRMRFVQISRS